MWSGSVYVQAHEVKLWPLEESVCSASRMLS